MEVPEAAECDALPPWPTFEQLDKAGFVAEDEHAAVVALGLLLAAASVLSLLPQFIKILKLRSAEGLSTLSLSASAIADVLQLASVAASSSPRFLACGSLGPWVCFVGALPTVQGLCQMLGSMGVLAAFAYFWVWPGKLHVTEDDLAISLQPTSAPAAEAPRTEKAAPDAAAPGEAAAPRGQAVGLVVVYALSVATLLAAAALPFMIGVCAQPVDDFAWIMAELSVLLSVGGGLPQIVVLARTCNVGSVSLSTTVLKLIGKILLAVEFMAEREPLSAYLPFLATSLTGAVQVTLIVAIKCRAARAQGPPSSRSRLCRHIWASITRRG